MSEAGGGPKWPPASPQKGSAGPASKEARVGWIQESTEAPAGHTELGTMTGRLPV